MKPSDRVKKLLEYTKLSKTALGRELGDINGQKFINITNGRNSFSQDLSKKITEKYPEINYTWLLTGEGNMFKTNEATKDYRLNKKGIVFDDNEVVDWLVKNVDNLRKNNEYFNLFLKDLVNKGVKKLLEENGFKVDYIKEEK